MPFANQSQASTPLLDALRECANKNHAPFYTPGHKRGQGISQQLTDCFGQAVFRSDLPELPELDNLFAPQGVIQQAQKLAAAAFGAEHTWFLVNGSTCGVEAAILATCAPGDKIILPRNVHSSAITALILSGAHPVFVNPEYDPVLDIAHSITLSGVQAALEQHPDAKAVMIVYPTYYGVCGDVAAIATEAHQYNIPLLVDEAHGPHFAFHPDLPTPALAAGADLTVQSIHKVLGAMTQASMLHVQGSRIDIEQVSKSLQLVQSTSPSYLLLASLDAARQQMALQGEQLIARTLQLADTATNRISQIPGLSVLQPVGTTPGFVALDRTRLTVTVSGLGLTGFAADEILAQHGVIAELPSLQHLTFIISLGNTAPDIERLVQAFTTLAKEERTNSLTLKKPAWDDFFSKLDNYVQISPRAAFFALRETLPLEQTRDRISAEIVCPYPPGIPVLIPGEVITSEALDYLQQIQAGGGFISGCADPSFRTLKVLKE
jgi:arginine decarboxylase